MINEKEFMIPLVLGITGHRDIALEDEDQLKNKIKEIFTYLNNKYNNTPFVLMTPLSDGADRIVAKAAIEFNQKLLDEGKDRKIDFKIILPFEEELYFSTFGVKGLSAQNDSIDEYKEIINKIKSQYLENEKQELDLCLKTYLPYSEKYNTLNDDEKSNFRHKQYKYVGEYISIHSHILIALQDPCSEVKDGGTNEIVNKKLTGQYDFYSDKNNVTPPEKGLVYRIITPRFNYKEKPKNKYLLSKLFPSDKFDIGYEEIKWTNKDENIIYSIKDLKDNFLFSTWLRTSQREKLNSFRQQHMRIEYLNKIILENKASINIEYKKDEKKYQDMGLILEDNKLENDNVENVNNKFIEKNSKLRRSIAFISNSFKKRLEHVEWIILILLFCTTSMILLKSKLPDSISDLLSNSYPIFVVLIFIIIAWFKNKKELYEDTRALSEGLRVQIVWNFLNINQSVAFSYLSRQKDEITWIRTTLRTLKIFYSPKEDIKISCHEIDSIDKYWIDEQKKYLTKNIDAYKMKLEKGQKVIKILFMLFVSLGVISTFNLYLKFFDNHEYIASTISTLTSLFLVFLTVIKAKQLFDGHSKTIKQYEMSLDCFTRAQQLILKESNGEKNTKNLQEIYMNLGKEVILENTSWIFLRREKNYNAPSL